MKRLSSAGVAVLALWIAGCGADSSLTIENQSSFTLVEIYLSPVDEVSWGDDLLGADVLAPGEALEISGVDCGSYDIRVVDETDAECILEAVDLCLDEATWSITDDELLTCGF